MEWMLQKTAGPTPAARKGASAHVVEGKIVFFGGSNGSALSDTFFLDIGTLFFCTCARLSFLSLLSLSLSLSPLQSVVVLSSPSWPFEALLALYLFAAK